MPCKPRLHRDLTLPKIHTIWTSALNEAPSARITSLKLLGRSIHEHQRRYKATSAILPPQYLVLFQIDLGLSLAFLGEYDMARESFQSALYHDKWNWIALFCLGLANAEVGEWDQAIVPWQECLDIFKKVQTDALHYPIFQFKGMQDVGLDKEWALDRITVEHNLEVALYEEERMSHDIPRRVEDQGRQGLYGIPAGVLLGPTWDPQLDQFDERVWTINQAKESKAESSPFQESIASSYESPSPPERRISKPLPPLPLSLAKPAIKEDLAKLAAKKKVSKLKYYWDVPDSRVTPLRLSHTQDSSQLEESAPYPYPCIQIAESAPTDQPSLTLSEYQSARAKDREQVRNRLMALMPSPISTQQTPVSECFPSDSEPEAQNPFRQSQISDVEDLIERWDEDVQKLVGGGNRTEDVVNRNGNQMAAYNYDYEDGEEYGDNTYLKCLSVLTAKDSCENAEGVIEEMGRYDEPNADAERETNEEDDTFLPPQPYSGYEFPSETFNGNGAEVKDEVDHKEGDYDEDSDDETIVGDAETPLKAKFYEEDSEDDDTPVEPKMVYDQYTLVERAQNRKTMVFELRAPNGGMRGFNARGREILLPRAFEGYPRENERRFAADAIRERIRQRDSKTQSQVGWVNGRASLIKELLRSL
ncbi:hypothetical protein OEA41_007365 [Lepraria neglecta]|uniref:Uncharacterized protein n=1 Tax=Lepraria neglecta TaxID=209136 RepID=A0AAD9ZCM6_9LECA|nr:hypothetical protein OEA41_007365 [Lepraria neglecta]